MWFKKYKNILAVIGVLLCFWYVFKTTSSDIENSCLEYNYFVNLNIQGIVTKKYIDSNDHNIPTIEWRKKSDKLDTLTLLFDTTNAFSLIQLNDSIIKRNNSDLLIIKKEDTIINKIIDFECPQNKK